MEAVYAEAVSVLRLHFVNVGDGDCILVEQFCGPRIFRMLVDTGLEEAGQQGPACMSCVEYLRRHAVRHLDVLFITHLHFDHFGGLRALLREVRVDEAYSSYFPEMSARAPRRGVMQGKSVTGLLDALTRWQQDVEAMRALGCRLHTATGGMVLQPTDTLRIELPECGEPLRILHRQIWQRLFCGQDVPPELLYWSSKARNPASLRLRLCYADRRVELGADCYGSVWQVGKESACDILKVPHHGDGKALTPALAHRLHPLHGVISCAAAYIPRKDRPSNTTAAMLPEQGTHIWFTDAFSAQWPPPVHWPAAVFTVLADGSILEPATERKTGG